MRKLIVLLVVAVLLLSLAAAASATDPWVNYTETDLGAGTWLYQFTIVNPVSSSTSVFDLLLETTSGVINSSPIGTGTGWQFNYLSFDNDQIHWFSPGISTDLNAGTSLGGFSFQTDTQYTGNFTYTLGGTSQDFTGNASVVPEPASMTASLALLSPVGFTLIWRMRRRRIRPA